MFQRVLSSYFFKRWPRGQIRNVPEKKEYSSARKLVVAPEFDFNYIVDPANRNELETNIKKRKAVNNLDNIVELYKSFESESEPLKKESILALLRNEASKLPNATHPCVQNSNPRIVKALEPVDHDFKARTFHELAKELSLLRMEELSNITGRRSYYFVGELAELEHALVKYTISKLLKQNFRLVSVPDILPAEIIDACGMNTKGQRTQVFKLDNYNEPEMCLAGTSEMGLASLYINSVIDIKDLPIFLASVSRCHRAELSTVREEQGLFRVHHFTKVEMFAIVHPNRSEDVFHELVDIQDEIFTTLGLEFSVVDMPAYDLGASAYRKYDIEAWFPGRGVYGEVSSCSTCTDFQSRRLNIKFRDGNDVRHVHTVNGTACAIPRTVMALFEKHQLENGNIVIPEPLRPYMGGRDTIGRLTCAREKNRIDL